MVESTNIYLPFSDDVSELHLLYIEFSKPYKAFLESHQFPDVPVLHVRIVLHGIQGPGSKL